jgi:uncharacterized repeat protein (TIGR02543 family)
VGTLPAAGSGAPTRAGYTFAGWSTTNAAIATVDFTADYKTDWTDTPKTVYALWNVNGNTPYTVQHYLVDGSGKATLHETEKPTGKTDTTTHATHKTNYTGYSYALGYSKGTDIEVANGNIAGNGSLVLKLYYTANRHNVSYAVTGAIPEGAPAAPTGEANVAYNTAKKVAPPLSLYGYAFSGWATSDASVAGAAFTMPDKDVAFTGSFAPKAVGVSFLLNDGTKDTYAVGNLANTGKKFTDNLNIFLPPVRTGYTFAGWYEDAAGTGSAWDFMSNTITVEGTLSLYAKWDVNTYTVRFLDSDGSVLSTQKVNYGSSATAPTAPARRGYSFTGWDKSFTNVTADMDVTARYTVLPAPPTDDTDTTPPSITTEDDTDGDRGDDTASPESAETSIRELPNGQRVVSQRDLAELSTEQGIPTFGVGDTRVPLFGPKGYASWALLNLILAAAGLILLIVAIARAVLRRNYNRSVRFGFFIGAAVLAAASAIAFLTTQDMSLPVVLVDPWTTLSAATLAAEITCIRLALPKEKMPVDVI